MARGVVYLMREVAMARSIRDVERDLAGLVKRRAQILAAERVTIRGAA